MAGSPRKPIPIEANVTPSWQAERYSLISLISCSASRARASPSADLFQARAASADQRELGGDEEGVHGDQHEHPDE